MNGWKTRNWHHFSHTEATQQMDTYVSVKDFQATSSHKFNTETKLTSLCNFMHICRSKHALHMQHYCVQFPGYLIESITTKPKELHILITKFITPQ